MVSRIPERRVPARQILVIGGGITGLTAGYRLAVDHPEIDVTVLEASDRPGGYLRTGPLDDPMLDGLPIDAGADAFLVRVPWALDLCVELGIDNELVSPSARKASLWLDDALWPIPSPNVLGVPLDPRTVAPGLLAPADLERLAGDGVPDVPIGGTLDGALETSGDLSVGAVIRACVGDRVFERLVDPMLGGINAGRADDLSCAVMAPQLLAPARSTEGLLAGLRRTAAAPAAPVFNSPAAGMERIVEALVAVLEDRLRTGSPVTRLDRAPDGETSDRQVAGWVATTASGTYRADAVILAVPAHVAATLVTPHSSDAGEFLAGWRHASVALATFAFDRADLEVPADQSGFLVGRATNQGPSPLMTACSFAGSKWAHLDHPERTVLRVSCGRIDDKRPAGLTDDELV
ncbi:MAG: protoporphyrinogen oxidase, partial [Acidimicrobiales bacterium]|nr:protoporphyrinogen oxidase [Acidimicrobiales bacterium]